MEIRPFRGWRYCTGPDGDISRFIAPPYDVLSAEDKQTLLDGSDKNIVGVDLPFVPPKDVGPDELYQGAAETLSQWKSSGVLNQEPSPAVYVYEQAYRWAGKSYTRRAMICGVRATELGRDVIPHEHTFAGPKADRLKLTEHTRMQLSPIFGFYNDPGGRVTDLLSAACPLQPDCQGRLHEAAERLWVVTDEELIKSLTLALREVPVFIADGHHRYTTAMNYRDSLLQAGRIDENHEANFVMFVLVAGNDPGLLILPTHRVVRNLKEGFSVERLVANTPQFEWRRCSVEDADLSDADAFLRRYGPHAIALMGANPAEVWIGKLEDCQAMIDAAPDELDMWRDLDVAIVHKLIIDRSLSPWRTEDLTIEYTPDGRAALAACQSGRAQLSICLQATPLAAVEAIATVGASMPHKSTYFYPKVATGMVLKPLE